MRLLDSGFGTQRALRAGSGPGRARSPILAEPGGRAAPTADCPGHAISPSAGPGADPPGPTAARARPAPEAARMTGGGAGRAGFTTGASWSRAGRPWDAVATRHSHWPGERAGGSAPGPAWVRRARAEGSTG
jgi:hypothetical protein